MGSVNLTSFFETVTKMNITNINSLPLEILMMIFSKVKLNDLKSAMLVSKKWKDIIEDPKMWKHFNSKPVFPEQVGKLLNIPRLCLMEKLEMRTGGEKDMVTLRGVDGSEGPKYSMYLIRRVEDQHINEIQKSEISDLDLSNCDLIKVTPDLLGDFLNNLKKLKLHSTVFTVAQLDDIFEKMSEFTNIDEVDLNFKSTDVTKHVEDEFISAGLNNIKTLTFPDMTKQLVNMQIEDFFRKMSEKTKIVSLDLTNAGIAFVPIEILAKALNNLETLKMTLITISNEHANAFFTHMQEFTNLKQLEIDTKNTNINSVNPRIFSKAIVKLTKVTLKYTYLNTEQLELMFQQILKKGSALTHLDVGTNDVSGVPADVLAEAVNKLSVVGLNETNLSKDQGIAIFTKLAESPSNLVRLDASENNLGEIDPDVIAKASNKLKIIHMSRCSLTGQQIEKIREQILIETKTSLLNIEHNSTDQLSAETIAKFDKKIKVLFQRTKKQKSLKQLCVLCGKGPFLRLRLHKCKSK